MGWEVFLLMATLLLGVAVHCADVKEETSPNYSRTYRQTRRYNGQSTGSTAFPNSPQSTYPGSQSNYPSSQGFPSSQGYPSSQSGYPSSQSGYPSSQSGYPSSQSGYPSSQSYPSSQDFSPSTPSTPGQYPSDYSSPGYSNSQTGYPLPQPPPRPPFNERPTGNDGSRPGYVTEIPARPGYSTQSPSRPSYSTESPSRPSYGPSQSSRPSPGFSSQQPGYSSQQPGYTSQQPGYSTEGYQPGYSSQPSSTTSRPGYSTEGGFRPSYGPDGSSRPSYDGSSQPSYGTDSTSRPGFVSELPSSKPGLTNDEQGSPGYSGFLPGTEKPGDLIPPDGGNSNALDDDEANHPPHIHSIDVQCGKESMTISIEFNRVFDGVIYSKGFYNLPNCRYVQPNSGRTRYTFTVSLDSCGTQFIDEFAQGKQAYLENVLVLQNEPGIQEVWDTVRSVRCLWEGTINKALSAALAVGSLQQEVVTFSGDTASARLDIQMGRGPYASSANGLVKIGDTMTLVVTVEGDPGFSVLVRDCWATDGVPGSANRLQLTDDAGCVLKPKLMGAFQETRDNQAIRTYSYFQAFKFPDVMDLMIECNVELCKAQCSPCQDPNARYEPGVRRRRWLDNTTSPAIAEPVKLGKKLHIYMPEELGLAAEAQAFIQPDPNNVCMSWNAFAVSFSVLLVSLILTSFITIYYVLRYSGRSNKYYR